ncbi:MAG: hypothetical protein LBJ44_11725 [Propionibacteriaceae bacterium]|jgi:hypothetical protein|nr:hypothetical protein [Propionibacteriaceae bacterium]
MTKILVLGGSGVSGRAVLRALGRTLPEADLSYTARRPDPRIEAAYVHFDSADRPDLSRRTLAGFDLALICVGPFEHTLASVHRLCLEAGLDCLDINDSIDARRAIVALGPAAERAGRTVLTGCGLCPGLSSLLLCAVADRDQVVGLRSQLLIGAKQEPGAASLRSMFATLGQPHRVLRQGQETTRPSLVERSDPAAATGPAPYLIGYECPDLDRAPTIFPGLSDYDYRVCFAQLSADQVEGLARAKLLRRPRLGAGLARFAARVGRRRVERTGAVAQEAVLTIELTDADGRTRTVGASGGSSYALTAVVAATVCAAQVGGDLVPGPGVFELVDRPESHPALLAALADHGVRWEFGPDGGSA